MKTLRQIIYVLVLSVLTTQGIVAAPVSVKAKLDSVNLLMGNMTTLRLEVVQDKGVKGEFILLRDAQADGYIGLCNDSVEMRTNVRRDTAEISAGRIQINYQVPIQSFDSGFYRLPQFVYVAGNDTALSNKVTLKVIPVPVNADDPISGYTEPVNPENSSILDYLPDWIADYWWLWLIVIALSTLLVYGYLRYRKTGVVPLIPRKPEPAPYDVAIAALRNLKARKLWEQGMEKEYFTQLVDILRVYLMKRFGINAMEMTSRQIKQTLSTNAELTGQKGYIDKVIDMADFVKFAGMRPLPDDNIAAFDDALRFVEETKPQPEPETQTQKPVKDA